MLLGLATSNGVPHKVQQVALHMRLFTRNDKFQVHIAFLESVYRCACGAGKSDQKPRAGGSEQSDNDASGKR
jgi:hypothetical protein